MKKKCRKKIVSSLDQLLIDASLFKPARKIAIDMDGSVNSIISNYLQILVDKQHNDNSISMIERAWKMDKLQQRNQ